MIELSIIIVYYKCPDLLQSCLKSVYAETKNLEFEIIVVDNHSLDNAQDMILHEFSHVNWIEMNYNSGFSRANNVGIINSKGKYILLLNPDTVILNNAIEKTFLKFSELPSEYAMIGCKLLNSDNSVQKSVYYYNASYLECILDNIFISKLLSGSKKDKPPDKIKSIMGSFMMFRRYAANECGLFDPDFFLYAEEIEWCSRFLKNNYKIYFFDEAAILHLKNNVPDIRMTKQRNISQALLFLKIRGKLSIFILFTLQLLNFLSILLIYPFVNTTPKQIKIKYYLNYFSLTNEYIKIMFKYNNRMGTGNKLLKYKLIK